MKRLGIFAAAAFLGALPAPSRAAGDDGAAAVRGFIEGKVNAVLEILRDKKLDKPSRTKRVMEKVDGMFDLDLMAKLSLGRAHWGKFSAEQRKEFTDLFVTQLKSSYTDKVDLLTDETVEFENPVEKSKGKYEMLTYILSKGERYKMLYRIYQKKDAIMIYDVEIEGISIVRSYGSQYDQVLRKDSPEGLIKKMQAKQIEPPKELEEKKPEGKKKAKPKG